MNLGVQMGVIKKSGAWFSQRRAHRPGQGNARLYLKSNKAVCEEIKAKIMEQGEASIRDRQRNDAIKSKNKQD